MPFAPNAIGARVSPLLLHGLNAAALVVCIEAVAAQSLTRGVLFPVNSPAAATLGAVLIVSIQLIAAGVTGRRSYGLLAPWPPLLALAATSAVKARFLSEPLYPWDFLFAKQVYNLLPSLWTPWAIGAAIAGLGALALAGVCVAKGSRSSRRTARQRLVALACGLLVAAPILYGWHPDGRWLMRDVFGVRPRVWEQKEHYAANGFLVAFGFNVHSAAIRRPSQGNVSLLPFVSQRKTCPAGEPTATRPDVIVLMNESFWDPTRLPGVHYSVDPTPTTRKLAVGEIFSPTFGGGTANTEFEALTGFSNAFLPQGSFPFQQYINKRMPSLVGVLKESGYRTLALHPYHKWFWNRETTYRHIGFEQFLGLDDLVKRGGQLRGPFFSDTSLSKAIIDHLDASDRPTFLHAVSMQNHGPYHPDRYAATGIKVDGQLSGGDLKLLESYASGVVDGDRGLDMLISWAAKRARPTAIYFFGDHLPILGPNFGIYDRTAFIKHRSRFEEMPEIEYRRTRETPLVIWSSGTGEQARIGTISPMFLPLLILRQLGLEHPFYTGFLGALWDSYRVIDRRIVVERAGATRETWAGEMDSLLKAYHAIQHDTLFGDRRLLPSLMQPATAGASGCAHPSH